MFNPAPLKTATTKLKRECCALDSLATEDEENLQPTWFAFLLKGDKSRRVSRKVIRFLVLLLGASPPQWKTLHYRGLGNLVLTADFVQDVKHSAVKVILLAHDVAQALGTVKIVVVEGAAVDVRFRPWCDDELLENEASPLPRAWVGAFGVGLTMAKLNVVSALESGFAGRGVHFICDKEQWNTVMHWCKQRIPITAVDWTEFLSERSVSVKKQLFAGLDLQNVDSIAFLSERSVSVKHNYSLV